MLKRVACSFFNAAAIDEESRLLVWGSPQSGLLGKNAVKSVEVPKFLELGDEFKDYKVTHVSVGPNHMAIIVYNKYLDEVDRNKYLLDKHKIFLKNMRMYLKLEQINLSEKFELQERTKIRKKEFARTLEAIAKSAKLSKEQLAEIIEIVDEFEDDEQQDYVNVVQFIYNLDPDYYKSDIVLTWGLRENGRLGSVDKPDNEQRNSKIKKQDIDEEAGGSLDYIQNAYKYEGVKQVKFKLTSDDPTHKIAIKKVECGGKFTLAIDTNGNLYGWGKGGDGCLGNGTLDDIWAPSKIKSFQGDTDVRIIDIGCGASHCLALSDTGEVYGWGNGKFGKLGHGSEKSELVPRKIGMFVKEGIVITAVACGERHSAAISEKKELYTWGCGSNYRLGHGLLQNETVPRLVQSIEEYYIIRVSCGANHTVAITNDGHMYAWGSGQNGRLGINIISDSDQMLPQRIGTLVEKLRKNHYIEAVAGPYQTFALNKDGTLFSWGSIKFQTLGIADLKNDLFIPSVVNVAGLKFFCDLDNLEEYDKLEFDAYDLDFQKHTKPPNDPDAIDKIARVFAGETTSAFLMENGDLYVTGSNQFGQLCLNPALRGEEIKYAKDFKPFKAVKEEKKPKKLPNRAGSQSFSRRNSINEEDQSMEEIAEKEKAAEEKKIRESTFNPIFFKENPDDPDDRIMFSYVPLFIMASFQVKFKYIACCPNHMVAITTEGQTYSWGRNSEAQLGLGFTNRYVVRPTLVEEVAVKKMVMCVGSYTYSASLSDSGDVWVWGTADYGSLGLSETRQNYDVNVPKLINDLPPMKYIAAGPQHMVVITKEGKLMSWGNPNNGRLGQGYNAEKTYAPQNCVVEDPKGEVKFVQVACGFLHTIALDKDGYVWGVGAKAYAGFPSAINYARTEEERIFQKLPGLKKYKFIHIASGEFHCLAVRSSLDIYGWGKSEYGKLAQDTFLNAQDTEQLKNITLPRRIERSEGDLDLLGQIPRYVAAGTNHSFYVSNKGEVIVWGCSDSGRLGIDPLRFRTLFKEKKMKEEYSVNMVKALVKLKFLWKEMRDYVFKAHLGKAPYQNMIYLPVELQLELEKDANKEDDEEDLEEEEKDEYYGDENDGLMNGSRDEGAGGTSRRGSISQQQGIGSLAHSRRGSISQKGEDGKRSSAFQKVSGATNKVMLVSKLSGSKSPGKVLQLPADETPRASKNASLRSHQNQREEYKDDDDSPHSQTSNKGGKMGGSKGGSKGGSSFAMMAKNVSGEAARNMMAKPSGFYKQTANLDDGGSNTGSPEMKGKYFNKDQFMDRNGGSVDKSGTVGGKGGFGSKGAGYGANGEKSALDYTGQKSIGNRERGTSIMKKGDERRTEGLKAFNPKNRDTNDEDAVADENEGGDVRQLARASEKPRETAMQKGKQIRLQTLIQNEDIETEEPTILSLDREIEKNFDQAFKKISKKVTEVKSSFVQDLSETESIAITSTYFIRPMPAHINNLLHTIPTFILQNIQIYSGLISILYNHPCYLFEILKSEKIDGNIVIDWIIKIYGGRMDDERTLNLLTTLCAMLADYELNIFPIDQPNLIKMMSMFAKIYSHILSMQACNMNFLKEIVQYLIKDVINGTLFKRYYNGKKQSPPEEYLNLDYYVKNKEGIGSTDFEERLNCSMTFLTKLETYIDNIVSKPDFIYMNKMSKHIRYLNYKIIGKYKYLALDRKYSKMFSISAATRKGESLIVELFFQRLSTMLLNFEKYGIHVSKENRKFLSEKNLMSLSILINKFYSREDFGLDKEFEPLNDYIKITSRSTDTVNQMIRGMANYDHYNLTLDNITRVLEDSYSVQDRINTRLSVRDLIQMQNFLCGELKNETIFLQSTDTDPLHTVLRALSLSQLDPNEFSYEVLNYKVNLVVRSKLLYTYSDDEEFKIYRCSKCDLTYPKWLISKHDIINPNDEYWECKESGCHVKRPYTQIGCDIHSALVEEDKYKKRFIFEK